MRRIVPRSLLAGVLLALPMSQLGHLAAYTLRYGPDSLARQSAGAHAYFPTLLQLSGAGIAALLLAGLLLLGIGRLLVGLRNDRLPRSGRGFRALLPLMLLVQLLVFTVQELGEAALAGAPAPRPEAILAWGIAGQLPVAILAALALGWLSGKVERAVRRIRESRPAGILPRTALTIRPRWAPVTGNPLRQAAPAVFGKRGPPFSALA